LEIFRSCILYIPFILSFPEWLRFVKIGTRAAEPMRYRGTCIKKARSEALGPFRNFRLTVDSAEIADTEALNLELARLGMASFRKFRDL
jgi:hypothetical protein